MLMVSLVVLAGFAAGSAFGAGAAAGAAAAADAVALLFRPADYRAAGGRPDAGRHGD